jgi:hypothetical protein
VISRKGDKGLKLEELLRAYFLRAGFFVVRSIPFQHAGDDLTDIDLWLYERPTGYSRRRQIVDAKSKTKPKAVERLLWTKGLAQLLEVDGAYVATTDSRSMLRAISKKLGIAVLDGADIRRISESDKVLFHDRINEEGLLQRIAAADRQRRDKELQLQYHDIKHSLIDNFGAGTINRGLEAFDELATRAVHVHPNTEAAEIALRLSYFAAAVVAIALDYIGAEMSFRTSEERYLALSNAIRYGQTDKEAGLERMRLAAALVQKYAPNGDATAKTMELALGRELANIPAEIIAEFVVRNSRSDLFQIARRLEHLSMSKALKPFDLLEFGEKAFVAALLDYAGVDRNRYASCWHSALEQESSKLPDEQEARQDAIDGGTLFSRK